MKGSLLGKCIYLFCAVAGIFVGYGIVAWNSTKENIDNTKDNTLIQETEDSVFFVEKNEREKQSENFILPKQDVIAQESEILELSFVTQLPSVTSSAPASTLSQKPQIEAQDWSDAGILSTEMPTSDAMLTPVITSTPNSTAAQIESMETSVPNSMVQIESPELSTSSATLTVTPLPKATITPVITKDNTTISKEKLPSLGMQWVSGGENVQQPTLPSVTPKPQKTPTAEVITYPVQIFGQIPVINRSDAYVSYFEFAYDLVTMLEPVVEARGLNMNSLLTQFVIKALLCGVNIEKLDINAPIPRRLAALCLWLAAQVLKEGGCETTAKSAEGYVKDIVGCSASEKKAIEYLYESGILEGYQVPGQYFYPQEGLGTEAGTEWISAVKQRWK